MSFGSMQNKVFQSRKRQSMADLTLLLTKKEKLNVMNIMLIVLVPLLSVDMSKECGVKLLESKT
jgi:hypothetical protein